MDANLRITHRMTMYQQQDSQGRLINIVRLILANGSQKFVEEMIEVETETEKLFDLSLAQGHRWYLTSQTMRVKPQHDHAECGICAIYDNKAVSVANRISLN